jgi:hypothetical protein
VRRSPLFVFTSATASTGAAEPQHVQDRAGLRGADVTVQPLDEVIGRFTRTRPGAAPAGYSADSAWMRAISARYSPSAECATACLQLPTTCGFFEVHGARLARQLPEVQQVVDERPVGGPKRCADGRHALLAQLFALKSHK